MSRELEEDLITVLWRNWRYTDCDVVTQSRNIWLHGKT